MDSKAPARAPTYTDGVDENGNPTDESNPKNSKYYAERVVHNDGSVTVTIYERHTNRVVSTRDSKPDADQQRIWAAQQKTVATEQAQAERKVLETTIGPHPDGSGRIVKITKHESGPDKIEALSPAEQREHELNQQRQRNAALPPGQDPKWETDEDRAVRAADTIKAQGAAATAQAAANKRTYGAPYRNAQGTWVKPYTTPDGQLGVEPLPPEAIPAAEADGKKYGPATRDPNTGKVVQAVLDASGKITGYEEVSGAPGEAPKPPEKQPTVVRDGKTYRIVYDEQGNAIREEEVPREESPLNPAVQRITRGYTPDINHPDGTFGLKTLQGQLLDAVAAGEITNAEARQALAQVQPLAELAIDRVTKIENTQRSVFGTNVQQRQQDLSDIQGRRSAATSASSTAFQYGTQFKLGPREIRYLMEMQRGNAENWGGQREVPRERPYPMTQGILGIGMDGQAGPMPGDPRMGRPGGGPMGPPPGSYLPRGSWAVDAMSPTVEVQAPMPVGGPPVTPPAVPLAPPPSQERYLDLLRQYQVYGPPPEGEFVDPIDEIMAMSPLAGVA